MTTTPSGDDDLERRFAELVAQEFPDDRPAPPPRQRRGAAQRPRPIEEPLTVLDRMDAADEEEWARGDNRVRPPALPPMRRWSPVVTLGVALMALSVVLTLLLTFGVPFPRWVNTAAMVAFVVGLGTLLFRLVTVVGPGRDDGDDGARL